jgi:DNA polymerase
VRGAQRPAQELIPARPQPGDREDLAGEPFVGPAGGVLDAALEDAGIERRDTYLTNVVKHFKWRRGRGKRRLHQRPNERGKARAEFTADLRRVAKRLQDAN